MADRGMAAVVARRVVARRVVFAAAVAAAAAAFAERLPLERYNSIIERQMFGPLPPNFDPTKSPAEISKGSGDATDKELAKEQEKVKSAIRFTVINVTPEGETAVGFTDNTDPKKPVLHYLKVGESEGGWEVRAADAKSATMTVVKDDVEVTLSLGDDSAKGAGKTESAKLQPANGGGLQRSGLLGASLGARRRARQEKREEEMRAREEERAKREAEREQREAERAKREEEDKARREAEREEMIEELKKVREELLSRGRDASAKDGKSASGDGSAPEGE